MICAQLSTIHRSRREPASKRRGAIATDQFCWAQRLFLAQSAIAATTGSATWPSQQFRPEHQAGRGLKAFQEAYFGQSPASAGVNREDYQERCASQVEIVTQTARTRRQHQRVVERDLQLDAAMRFASPGELDLNTKVNSM